MEKSSEFLDISKPFISAFRILGECECVTVTI